MKLHLLIIPAILIPAILISCYSANDGGSDKNDDQTCWAHAAADILTAEGLDDDRDVYAELVNHFGDDRGYTTKAITWWLNITGQNNRYMKFRVIGDMDILAYWLFEDGAKAIGFREKEHMMTAYKYEDIKGYNVNRIVWIQ